MEGDAGITSVEDCIRTWSPYILQVRNDTGLNAVVIGAQWGLETGWHQTGVRQGRVGWHGQFNLAGIMGPDGYPQDFSSYEEFAARYIAIIEAYAKTMGPPGSSIADSIRWLSESPWNGSHYMQDGHNVLQAVVDSFGDLIHTLLFGSPLEPRGVLTVVLTVAGYRPVKVDLVPLDTQTQ